MKLLCLILVGLAVAGAVVVVLPRPAFARTLVPDDPAAFASADLLGKRISDSASGTVHLVYIHGMRANDVGASGSFRRQLEKRFQFDGPPVRDRHFVKFDAPPPPATYHGQPIWTTEQEWLASRPFVDTYRYRLSDRTILVSELNWWPLLHPLKCRFLVAPETRLSGREVGDIERCAQGDPGGRTVDLVDGFDIPIHYPWFDAAQHAALLKARPLAGKGAWPNGKVKRQIVNWGLSDAVIALGTMRPLIVDAIDESFAWINEKGETADTRIAITESLGSFVLMDAATDRKSGPAHEFVKQTADYYFFANQFALLELARLKDMPDGKGRESLVPSSTPGSPLDLLFGVDRGAGDALADTPPPELIVAISDPSDALTFMVPKSPDPRTTVVNVLVRESGGLLGLFANPLSAHRGAIDDPKVWDRLLRVPATP